MRLSIRIVHREQGGFVALVPSLPGCKCFGQTRQEAADGIDEVIRGYIAALSNFVPEKLYHEVVEAEA